MTLLRKGLIIWAIFSVHGARADLAYHYGEFELCPLLLTGVKTRTVTSWQDFRRQKSDVITTSHRVGKTNVVVNYKHTDRGIDELLHGSRWSGPVFSQDSLDLELFKGRKIFDAAAGDGKLVRELKERGFEADGVDIKFLNVPSADWPPGVAGADLINIPRRTQSQDVVISSHGPLSYENPSPLRTQILKELARITRRSGIIKLGPVLFENLMDDLSHVPELEIKYYRAHHQSSLKPGHLLLNDYLRIENSDVEVVLGFKGVKSFFNPRMGQLVSTD